MKEDILTTSKQEDYISPLQHYCDIRSLVYSMTSTKLCTAGQFVKDTENVKNYCKGEVEPNSIYLEHIISLLICDL